MKLAILGGGLTGMALGYLLNQRDVSFEILEKESECGGLMRSLQEAGFTFDFGGSHIIFSKDEEVLNFIIDILKDNKIKNRRNTKILYKNHYVKYPFENGLADLSMQDNFECLHYFIQNLLNKEKMEKHSPQNIREWCYHTFGKGIADKYLIPYNEKIWKYPLEKMNLDWVERIPNPPVEDIIRSSLGMDTEGYAHQLYFYYPKTGGIQSLIQSFKKDISNNIIRNFEIKSVRKEGDGWIVSNGQEEKTYDEIISTIPIFGLINAINAPTNVKNAANNLNYNSLITVMIGLNDHKINNCSWLYIPNKEVLTHRISFPSNYSPYVSPKGKTSVLAEITCNIGDDIWRMKDEEIIEKTIEDLYELKIIDKSNVCYSSLKRLKYAYVISDLDYNKNMHTIKEYFEDVGIMLCGRFSEFQYMNMDACIRSAMNLVNERY